MVQIGGRFMFLLPHFLNAEKCSPENARQYLRVFSPPLTNCCYWNSHNIDNTVIRRLM
jgi:hypothetical protein